MSTELTTQSPRASALSVMASRFQVEPAKLLSTLKSTVFKGASDDELLALVVVANEYGLNPLTKEIYAFPAKGGGIVPVISIDGWINRMNGNAAFDGIEFADVFSDDKKPVSVTATIWRKDRSRPIKVTEYYAECRRNTEPWNNMPSRMLRHKALCQCVRVAFGFGGVYDEDEARDLMIRDVTPARMVAGPDLASLPKAEPLPVQPAPAKRVRGNKSPAQADGAQGEPAPADSADHGGEAAAGAVHETKPAPETKPDHDIPFELQPVTKLDVLKDAMTDAGMTVTDLRAVCFKAKLPSDFAKLSEVAPDTIKKLLADWENVLVMAGKGGAES